MKKAKVKKGNLDKMVLQIQTISTVLGLIILMFIFRKRVTMKVVMQERGTVHVMYGSTLSGLLNVATSIISVVNYSMSKIHFHVFFSETFDIQNSVFPLIEKFYYPRVKINIYYFDISKVNKYFPYTGFWNKMTFARLFVIEEMKDVEKAIYLDTDVYGCDDIYELYKTDLGSALMGGCPDSLRFFHWIEPDHPKQFNLTTESYLNAGVLLMNMTELKKTHFFDKSVKAWNETQFFYGDQDLINLILGKQRKVLDRKFNKVYYDRLSPCVLRHFNHLKVNHPVVFYTYQDFRLYFDPLYKFKEFNKTIHARINRHNISK